MPLISITFRGAELQGKTTALLERAYKFSKLKLLHIYHNIDSIHLNDAASKTEQSALYIRLGGLVENGNQIINYNGDFRTFKTSKLYKKFTDTNLPGNPSPVSAAAGADSNSVEDTRYEPNVDINHLIPIGASRHNTGEIISRDVFKDLHTKGILDFHGELEFELFFTDKVGIITSFDTGTGGIVLKASSTQVNVISYMTLMFEYEE